jgi:hypothetical protein
MPGRQGEKPQQRETGQPLGHLHLVQLGHRDLGDPGELQCPGRAAPARPTGSAAILPVHGRAGDQEPRWVFQILGVLIVVWDLLNIHEYLGDLGRVTARLRAHRAQVEAAVRRLLRRPGPSVVVHAQAASGIGIAGGSVTARLTPGPFVPQPDRPPAEQLAAQAEYLNRLRDWIMREVDQRDRAIEEERALARAELRAEGQRLERLVDEVRGEVERLRKLTTGGIGLRWVGVPILLFGVAFSAWPDGWAEKWPTWLSPPVSGFLAACVAAAWLCWAILVQLRRDSATS